MAIEHMTYGGSMLQGPLREIEREMERVFDHILRDWGWPPSPGEQPRGVLQVDVINRGNEIVLRVDLPGLDEEDIDITIAKATLTIHGEREGDEDVRDDDYYAHERWKGRFSRTLALPTGVDSDHATTVFKNGVLEIRMPKAVETTATTIDIKGKLEAADANDDTTAAGHEG